MASDYYEHYLESAGLFRILGLDTVEPGGMLARLRFSRRRNEPRFSADERNLLARIAPHLRLSIQLYATLSRTVSERNLYAGAVEQLAVATIVLDEQGRILSTNTIARALLDEGNGLSVRGQHLVIDNRDKNRELQTALETIIKAQHRGETSVVRALRVPRSGGHSQLGLVLRPVPVPEWGEGQSSPCVAVFISDPELNETASQGTLGQLFDLTPAEAQPGHPPVPGPQPGRGVRGPEHFPAYRPRPAEVDLCQDRRLPSGRAGAAGAEKCRLTGLKPRPGPDRRRSVFQSINESGE